MPILASDIKLIGAQVMDDVPEGGGAPSGIEILDGASNSLFNDISELDRASGRVNLRKVFAAVETPNTEGYFGANLIVAAPPATAPIRALHTASWAVTPETRSGTVVTFVDPPPASCTTAIHCMAQGKWYVLRDAGDGSLVGIDAAYGAGQVTTTTDSVLASFSRTGSGSSIRING